mmetsp:Transcript_102726/g.295796  ORF Transcript_102726/g.295796 Transcript_102726/m.295796 type:complete len:242 (+) Transcript_102726:785-1510(+)
MKSARRLCSDKYSARGRNFSAGSVESLTQDVQSAGKTGPGLSMLKSELKNCSLRRERSTRSALTSCLSFVMWAESVGGGTKCSPSSRRSESCGWKMSKNRARSSGANSTPFCSSAQKALPPIAILASAAWTASPHLPFSEAAERLNLSKLRSTPCGAPMLKPAATFGAPSPAREAAMDIVALKGADKRANWRAGPTARPVRVEAMRLVAGRPSTARPATTEVATRLGAESRKRSMPKSTPP